MSATEEVKNGHTNTETTAEPTKKDTPSVAVDKADVAEGAACQPKSASASVDSKSSKLNGAPPPKHDKKPSHILVGNGVVSGASPIARARSTPDPSSSASPPLTSPLLASQSNPHPPPTASFSPQAPIPLSHPWSMYLDDTNLWGVQTVEECLVRMGYLGTVDSIQAFWTYWNAMDKKLLTEKKLGALSCIGSVLGGPMPTPPPAGSPTAGSGGNGRYNWRIFDSVITPVWEDETHVHGGKYVLRCGNGDLRATKWIWTKLVLSMVGSMFLHQEVICGCVLACRPHKKEIQVWVKHTPPKLKEQKQITPPTPTTTATPTPTTTASSTGDGTGEVLPSDAPTSDKVNNSTSSTNSSCSSPALSPSTSPPPHPTPSPSASPSSLSKVAVCTCHIDPVVCVANDIRFLLGVPLSLPGSNSSIKIEYIPHEVTMADVAARNKRLKHKMHSRRESAADGSKKGASGATNAKLTEKQMIEAAREERNKQRDRDTKLIQEEKLKKVVAANKASIAAAAGAAPGSSPLASPTPTAESMKPSPSPSPKVLSSPPAGSPSYPGRNHSSWADASDAEEIDLGIESDAYGTSTYGSASSSAQSTPLHSGHMPTRSLRGGHHGGRKISSASMFRQSSDPSSETSAAIQRHLDMLARSDSRTFEGTVGDAGMSGRGASGADSLNLESPALLELARKNKGTTPLKLSGERGYHPEPDSPGFNGTPGPSPSTTPLGFYDGGVTPPPRSPFTAHSPHSRGDRSRADSSTGSRILTTRGAGRLSHGGIYVPGSSPDAMHAAYGYPAGSEADDLDAADREGSLQYDPLLSPNDNKPLIGLTRDLLRVPLDLESLSLPPAGRQPPQRLRDPIGGPLRAGGPNGESILSMVGPQGEVLRPDAKRANDPLSKLIISAQPQTTRLVSASGEGSAFGPVASSNDVTPAGSRKGSFIDGHTSESNNAGVESHSNSYPFSRKKSSAHSHPQQAKKRLTKPKVDEPTPIARRSKPKSMKTYALYACLALFLATMIYFLFFTTIAPEPEPYLFPERTIAEKGAAARVKVPKVQTK